LLTDEKLNNLFACIDELPKKLFSLLVIQMVESQCIFKIEFEDQMDRIQKMNKV